MFVVTFANTLRCCHRRKLLFLNSGGTRRNLRKLWEMSILLGAGVILIVGLAAANMICEAKPDNAASDAYKINVD